MKRKHSLIIALIAAAALLATLACSTAPSSSTKNPNGIPSLPPGVTSVPAVGLEMTIDASSVLKLENVDQAILDLIHSDGMMLNSSKLSTPEGSTVSDVLKNTCRLLGISLNVENGEYGSFVKGIGGISNGDFGTDSFWLLKVNGKFSDVGGDFVEIKEGDIIEWVYTCDGGSDVGYTAVISE